jgi:thymidylate synthase (FAD)
MISEEHDLNPYELNITDENGVKVEFMDKMGTDLTIPNVARVSFDKVATEFTEAENRLTQYLADHEHWSPFAHAMIQTRVTAPIAIARQLFKHKVGFVENEVSRRYVSSAPVYYMPTQLHYAPEKKKQGTGAVLEADFHNSTLDYMLNAIEQSHCTYVDLIRDGIAPEEARLVLPQCTMTQWVWTGSLYAYYRVWCLRHKPDAQQLTQYVAGQIDRVCREHFPNAWGALIHAKA